MDLPSLEATARLARTVVDCTEPGALVLLAGPLGAGKTTLVQQIGAALGSPAHISSPTYTLIHEYPSPAGLIVHSDAYRLADARLLADMGLDDYLARARLVVVEWGEPLRADYPDALLVVLELSGGERKARLEPPLVTL